MTGEEGKGQRGLPDGLRTAIERTLAATLGSAAETRGRAQELVDDLARRGQDARDVSASVTQRVVDAIGDLRLAGAEDVHRLEERIALLEVRLSSIEQAIGGAGAPRPGEPPADAG